jgi:hypothetical protein
MGKTSLLLMLKYRQMTAFLPTTHDCVLMKLGPNTLDRIAAVSYPANTVLLLDSLDEDEEAHSTVSSANARLLGLLPRMLHFHRSVITCRCSPMNRSNCIYRSVSVQDGFANSLMWSRRGASNNPS